MAKDIVIIVETNFRAFFDAGVLDEVFSIKIDNKTCIVHTPVSKTRDTVSLSAPEHFNIRGDYIFGTCESHSNRTSIGALVIEVPTDEEDEVSAFKVLSKVIDEHLKRFDSWAIVLSGQAYTETRVTQEYKKDMFWADNSERLRASPGVRIQAYLGENVPLVTSAQVKYIIKAIETFRDFSLELEYYKSALVQYRYGRYADCGLSSGTASEIFVRRKIRNYLSCASREEKDAIMDGLHGLKALYSFAKKIGCKLPCVKELGKISNPRNKAIHEGIKPDKNSALKTLEETRKILSELLLFDEADT